MRPALRLIGLIVVVTAAPPLRAQQGLPAQPPATAIVDVGRARLETATWGNGDPVILLPGTGYSATSFRLVGPELARRGYRAIAVNPRGVAGSTGPLEGLTYHDYAADVGALIDRVAGGRAHVLGWAWGNRIARTLAADAPQRVATVILLAAGGKVPADPIVAETTKRLRDPALSRDERTRTLALRLLAPGSDPAVLLPIQESWPEAQAAQAAAGRATRLEEWWAGGTAPMLVVQGLQDKVAPPGNGRDLKTNYPDRVTLVEIDGAGHGIVVEQAARIGDEAARFFRAHPIRGAAAVVRTPWGDPDLQGVWDYWTFTPLERPKEFADKPVLTDAEAAELARRLRDQAVAGDARRPGPGNPGGYSQEAWTDRARASLLNQTSLIVDPPDGRIPPLTPEAQKAEAVHRIAGGHPVRMRTDGVGDDDAEDRGLSERCLLGFSTGPPFQPGGYNNNVQIVQTPGYVVLLLEMNHVARIIPMNNRPHLPGHMWTWLGDSRGRWEGNTLVVESTNFTPKMASFSARRGAAGYEIGDAQHLRLVERFTRIDARTLQYEFTVHDPTTFTRPFTGKFPMNWNDQQIYEFACHEGNYGLTNILRGGRVTDGSTVEGGQRR
jgi:pimeloyl-ACP methyl ester carboxylesterase